MSDSYRVRILRLHERVPNDGRWVALRAEHIENKARRR